eukprot:5755755-Pyramimonas_sp.AAC.1
MATPLRGQYVREWEGYPQLEPSYERTKTGECIRTLRQLPLSSRSKGRVKKSSGKRQLTKTGRELERRQLRGNMTRPTLRVRGSEINAQAPSDL